MPQRLLVVTRETQGLELIWPWSMDIHTQDHEVKMTERRRRYGKAWWCRNLLGKTPSRDLTPGEHMILNC